MDFLAGTSIGSAVAALVSLGYTPDDGAKVLDVCGSNAFRLALSTASVLSNNGLRGSLQVVGQDKRIEELQIPETNPALALCQRCGFTEISRSPPNRAMRRLPSPVKHMRPLCVACSLSWA